MLISWMSHDVYCSFISQGITSLSSSDLIRLRGSFSDSLDKLTSLDLDPVLDLLLTYYFNTGRLAEHQPQILRFFLLMGDLKETSIKNWVHKLHSKLGATTCDRLPLGYWRVGGEQWYFDNDSLDILIIMFYNSILNLFPQLLLYKKFSRLTKPYQVLRKYPLQSRLFALLLSIVKLYHFFHQD